MRSLFLAIFLTPMTFGIAGAQTPATSAKSAESPATLSKDDTPTKTSDPEAKNGPPSAQTQNDYVRPDSKTRFKRYVNSMIGPAALGKNVASAAFATWRNSTEEWGQTWEGFGRRVASGFGKSAIKNTTMYGLDEALKYDSRFYRSKKKDFGSRLRNALISPVTARNAEGKRVVGIPRLAGTYGSRIISYETWYPDRYDYKDGLKAGTISLGVSAAINLFKEFVWK